jgi:hypothetical protein
MAIWCCVAWPVGEAKGNCTEPVGLAGNGRAESLSVGCRMRRPVSNSSLDKSFPFPASDTRSEQAGNIPVTLEPDGSQHLW